MASTLFETQREFCPQHHSNLENWDLSWDSTNGFWATFCVPSWPARGYCRLGTSQPPSQTLTPEPTMPPEATSRELEAVATPAGSGSPSPQGGGWAQNCWQDRLCNLRGPGQNENAGPLFKIGTNQDSDNRTAHPVQSPCRHGAPCDCSGHSPWSCPPSRAASNLSLQSPPPPCCVSSPLTGPSPSLWEWARLAEPWLQGQLRNALFSSPGFPFEGSTLEGARNNAFSSHFVVSRTTPLNLSFS